MTTPHFPSIATKLRELAVLFDAAAADSAPTAASPVTESPKRVRPAKAPDASQVLIPKEDDTKVTAEHPQRAALKAACAKLIAASDKPSVQAAVKLFGPNTNELVDVQLEPCLAHINALLAKKQAHNDDV